MGDVAVGVVATPLYNFFFLADLAATFALSYRPHAAAGLFSDSMIPAYCPIQQREFNAKVSAGR